MQAIEAYRPQHSWEQQPGEHEEAYRCFAVFRSMGARRSVVKVAKAYHKELLRVDPSCETKFISTHNDMRIKSRRWNWTDRAKAYDAYMMLKHGEAAAVGFVKLIDETVKLCQQAIKEGLAKPTTFKELIEGLNTIASLIPPETLRAICDNARLAEPGPAAISA